MTVRPLDAGTVQQAGEPFELEIDRPTYLALVIASILSAVGIALEGPCVLLRFVEVCMQFEPWR